jgi:RNA methyltransferase, TrmH family
MLSRTHPLARRLRALRADPALRDGEGVLVAEGIHLAFDALAAGARIESAVVSPRLAKSAEGQALLLRLEEAGVRPDEAADALLDSLQDARSPQPVVLIVRWKPVALDRAVAGRGGVPLLVVACGVQEPGNLGALWRTADAAGATGFLVTPGSASLTHPRSVRASMGSVFRLPAGHAELGEILKSVESRGLRVVGADARDAVSYDEIDWAGPLALLLGNEGAGLPDEVAAHLDARARIPMAPGVESLSVNAAAAVLLFEAARKRRTLSRA